MRATQRLPLVQAGCFLGPAIEGRAAGYAGIGNLLFYKPGTKMRFGDSKDAIEQLVAALRSSCTVVG